jgi:O-methyltransferase involved in polyketide biosynthesis
MARHPELTYVEADLPDMAAMKRRLLDHHQHRAPSHLVVSIDALADDGEDSIAGVCARLLDPEVGTAVITEGLIGYFDEPKVRGIWRRVAATLRTFPAGLYLADLFVPGSHDRRAIGVFSSLLAWFARGSVHLHFAEKGEGVAAASEAGFARAAEIEPDDERIGVRILAARTP